MDRHDHRRGAGCGGDMSLGGVGDVHDDAIRAGTDGATGMRQPELDSGQTKIEMRRVTREVGRSEWITGDLSGEQPPPPSRHVGPMKIGIRWQGDLDLDLYARPTPQSETLFFDHPRSAEGYYFKDHRTSPELEYEFIEFETPVDVWEMKVSVNFYEGTAPEGTEGEARVSFDGHVYSRRFTIPARNGNEGRAGRGQERFWAGLNVPEILGLR